MNNISRILIANRGEIASRVIRTCRKMGITAIAVYADADKGALYVQEANKAVYIGASEPSESYLDQNKIIAAAKSTNAEAIHPGYGFLSENSEFARRCEKEGLIFIGPNPDAIDAMGSKSNAKSLMQTHNVPVVPGYQGDDQSEARFIKESEKIGFPVLLKAAAGGGGKGMRIVEDMDSLPGAIAAAKRESKSSFGDDELIIEKYIRSGRHIEFQIFGDKHGNVIHVLERECSIQRRYQKVIEESPSPIMTDVLRKRMGQAAILAAKALSYDNAGTVEFIYDDASGEFYFLEVNTRLQVEHPVTEAITGLDLVQMQIESASGKALKIQQENIRGQGYAIEVRLYAEDPSNNFIPQTGKILKFATPKVEGLRVETAIQSGSEISIYYDPMIAKLIMHADTRFEAIQRMNYALGNMTCLGIQTNQEFLHYLTELPDFVEGEYDTHYIQNHFSSDALSKSVNHQIGYACMAASIYSWQQRESQRTLLRSLPSGWRNSFYDYQKDSYEYKENSIDIKYKFNRDYFEFKIGDEVLQVFLHSSEEGSLRLIINGIQSSFNIARSGRKYFIQNEDIGTLELSLKERLPQPEKEIIKGAYMAPMPSQIIKILVKEGQEIKKGEQLMVISSMKMENSIEAIEDGVVTNIFTAEGNSVEAGTTLMQID